MSVEEIRDLHPFRCSEALAEELSRIPTEEEIKAVFFKMPKCKAPGPDGFSVEFFMDAWEIVGEEATHAVQEFFTSGRLLKNSNATSVALILRSRVQMSSLSLGRCLVAPLSTKS